MAAGQSALAGSETLLLEKMSRPGRKLRITGKGRCNLTNTAPVSEFLTHYGQSGRFLRQAYSRFFAPDLVAFFEHLRVPTVTERGGRVFTASDQAQDVVDALVRWVTQCGVTVRTRSPVQQVIVDEGQVVGVRVSPSPARLPSGSADSALHADAVLIATGGASYPATGSTGDGYQMARSLGHRIVPIRPGLVPLKTEGNVASRLQGLSLRNVSVRLLVDDRRQVQAFGEMLFTRDGVSGPVILTISRPAVDALRSGCEVALSIDLKPALDDRKLDARLLRDLDAYGKRQVATLLKGLLPRKLIPVCTELTGVPPHKLASQVTAEERGRLRVWLKDFPLRVTGHHSFDQAIVTAGGVDTREIDPRTMASRLVRGLYFAGEVIDVDGDTGGYNLQAAFSTGWIAGRAAARAASQ
jgi:predicted Rossmann fold flavoprotein